MPARPRKPARKGGSAPHPPGGSTGPLADYRGKRSADHTGEPFGGEVSDHTAPRIFVIQQHAARRMHWDLRLEIGGVLRSWAVPRGPSSDPSVQRLAVETEDHPLEYADFEGIIPPGNYGAGAMIVWDRGTWTPLSDVEAAHEAGKLLFELRGHKLSGLWTLVRTRGGDGRQWLLIKKPDAAATPGSDGDFDAASILSGLTVEQLGSGQDHAARIRDALDAVDAPRTRVDPSEFSLMLAEIHPGAFDDPEWIFELKYDGYRLLATRDDARVRLSFRSGGDATDSFPEIRAALAALPFPRFVIDAEVVVLDDDARPNFARLQERAPLGRPRDIRMTMRKHPATLYAFDLVAFDDFDLRELPLLQRKAWLAQMLPRAGTVRFADHVPRHGTALMEEVRRLGIEGIMAKRADSRYVSGRSSLWRKIRIEHSSDFVVVAFEPPEGRREGFRALELAAYDGEDLVYVGRVGTGFSDRELRSIRAALDRSISTTATVVDAPTSSTRAWVQPEMVVEVRYKTLTRVGRLRAPVFVRSRPDKTPRDCVRPAFSDRRPAPRRPPPVVDPQPAGPRVVVSNPDKVLWPEAGYTKQHLVDYYRNVAPWLLPYLRDRPLVLTRYPDGIDGKSFFQKNAPPYLPDWVRTKVLWNDEEQREVEYFVCDDADALAYVANMATIPLHVRASRLSSEQAPDWCVLDLDPKTAPFTDVVSVARHIHELCETIGLPNYCKTSGSTGLHVLVPLSGALTFAQCKQLAELLARVVVDELPTLATVERSVGKREGKVYVDYGQNGHSRLIASPLCVRPRPGAPVSTPLRWDEVVPSLDHRSLTIETVLPRLANAGDPMAEILTTHPDVLSALDRLLGRLHPR